MIVLYDEAAYFLGARRIEIKHGIHKIDFLDIPLKPEEDLLLDPIQIKSTIPYRKVLVVEAEVAAKHTPSLGFNANDSPLMVCILRQVGRRKMVQVLQYRGVLVINDFPRRAKTDPSHAGDSASIFPGR